MSVGPTTSTENVPRYRSANAMFPKLQSLDEYLDVLWGPPGLHQVIELVNLILSGNRECIDQSVMAREHLAEPVFQRIPQFPKRSNSKLPLIRPKLSTGGTLASAALRKRLQ